jgi:hypothetical protein
MPGDQLVELGLVLTDQLSESAREGVRIPFKRVLGRFAEQITLVESPDRSPTLV